MNNNSLLTVFHEQLQDIYSIQKQSSELFPYLISAAFSIELKEAFKHKLEVIHDNIEVICRLFNQIDISCDMVRSKDMDRLVEKALSVAGESGDPVVRDAKLIIMVQEIEHYIIVTLDILGVWAQVFSEPAITEILQKLLNDEYASHLTLNRCSCSLKSNGNKVIHSQKEVEFSASSQSNYRE